MNAGARPAAEAGQVPRSGGDRDGAKQRLARAAPVVALVLLIAAAALSNQLWLAADDTPLPGADPYSYLARLLDFRHELAGGAGLGDALAALSHNGRPPLYQLATLPLLLAFGPSEDALTAVNLAVLALLGAATFALGRRVAGPWAGVLAAALALSYPPVLHLARTYLPHLAAAACGAWSLALLAALVDERSPGRALLLGLSLGVGLLVHPSFLWAVAVPTVLFGIVVALDPDRRGWRAAGELFRRPGAGAAWRRRLAHPLLARGLLPGAALAALVAVPWYASIGRPVVDLQGLLTSDAFIAYRGFERFATAFHDVPPGFGWYARTAPAALSWPLAVAIALGAAVCALRLPRRAAVPLVAVAATYTLLAVQPTLSWIYPPLALPAAAVLSAAGLAALRPRPLAATAAAVAVASALLAQIYVPWGGVLPGIGRLASAAGAAEATGMDRFSCRRIRAFCAIPPAFWQPPIHQALRLIHADPACRRSADPCLLLVVQGPGIEPPTFEYVARRDWPGWRLEIAAQNEAAWGLQFPLDALLRAEYVFFVAKRVVPAPGRLYRAAATNLLRAPPGAFAHAHRVVARWPLPGRGHARLLHRTAPLSEAEIADTVAALDLDSGYTTERYLALGRLYAEAGRLDDLAALIAEGKADTAGTFRADLILRSLEEMYYRTKARLETEAAGQSL